MRIQVVHSEKFKSRITLLWMLSVTFATPAWALDITYSNPFFRVSSNSTESDVGSEIGRFVFFESVESSDQTIASAVENDRVAVSARVDWFSISTEAFADTTRLAELGLGSLSAESLGRFEVDFRVDAPEPFFFLEIASTQTFDREIVGPERAMFPLFGPGLSAFAGVRRRRLTSSSGLSFPLGPIETRTFRLATDEIYRFEMAINSVVGGKEVSGTAFHSSNFEVSLQALPIPEPASATLLGLGLVALATIRRPVNRFVRLGSD